MDMELAPQCQRLPERLLLAVIVTLAYLAVPDWLHLLTWRLVARSFPRTGGWDVWWYQLLALAFGLVLTIGAPRRNGLRIGGIKRHWKGVLLVCCLPVALTGMIYPFLPVRPFAGQSATMWLVSPWSQDLVFAGFLFGLFETAAPSYIHPKVRVRWALVLAACFFSLHHLPNLLAIPGGYVAFQLCYTFLGMLLVGLARQWTGSIIYGAISHVGINFIAWATS